MTTKRAFGLLAAAMTLVGTAATADAGHGKAFEWTTKSAEAKKLLGELQGRIENYQFGPENLEIAKKIVAADPHFAMGEYYSAASAPGPETPVHFKKALELAAKASDGERRFIQAMEPVFVNQGANFKDAIAPLTELAKDYPGERLVWVILGQLHNATGQGAQALEAFKHAKKIGPRSPRVEAFLAGNKLIRGQYADARAAYAAIEKELPEGSVPFAIRYGTTFSHLYEGNVDAALGSLESFLVEYRKSGATQTFPEVFIWNSVARINLENGRLEKAMHAYDQGYKSVPDSKLPENQKKTWLGRVHHGKARVLAKMGQHAQAWEQVETVKKMIDDGGDAAKQFLPTYHYLAGYCKLEAGKLKAAAEHLTQTDPNDPFHKLLLARTYEGLGKKAEAKKAYAEVLEAKVSNMERALAYPEAKRKLASM